MTIAFALHPLVSSTAPPVKVATGFTVLLADGHAVPLERGYARTCQSALHAHACTGCSTLIYIHSRGESWVCCNMLQHAWQLCGCAHQLAHDSSASQCRYTSLMAVT